MIQLWHGDCLELMRDIPDNSIDMVLTDCPYRLTPGGRKGNAPKGGFFTTNHEELKTGKFFKENDINFNQWLPETYRVCKQSGHIYSLIMVLEYLYLHRGLWDVKKEGAPYRYPYYS